MQIWSCQSIAIQTATLNNPPPNSLGMPLLLKKVKTRDKTKGSKCLIDFLEDDLKQTHVSSTKTNIPGFWKTVCQCLTEEEKALLKRDLDQWKTKWSYWMRNFFRNTQTGAMIREVLCKRLSIREIKNIIFSGFGNRLLDSSAVDFFLNMMISANVASPSYLSLAFTFIFASIVLGFVLEISAVSPHEECYTSIFYTIFYGMQKSWSDWAQLLQKK